MTDTVLADVSCTLDFFLAGFLATVDCSGHCSQCIFAVEAPVSWRSARRSALWQTKVGCPGWGADLRIAEPAQIVCNTFIGWDSVISFRENAFFHATCTEARVLDLLATGAGLPRGWEVDCKS